MTERIDFQTDPAAIDIGASHMRAKSPCSIWMSTRTAGCSKAMS